MPLPLLPVAGAVALGKMAWDFATGTADAAVKVKETLGQIEDEVTVTVSGNPLSNKKQLYHLAAAVGFGLIERLVPAGGEKNPLASPGLVAVEYDATTKEVSFVIRYSRNLITVATFGAGAAGLRRQPVYDGPKDVVVGAPWDFRTDLVTRVVSPTLEFAGKTVLTDRSVTPDPNPAILPPIVPPNIPTGNPRPSGDARSRGSLIQLVWQALADPVESFDGQGTHSYVLPTNANRFSGG